jgi:hypothetical protein
MLHDNVINLMMQSCLKTLLHIVVSCKYVFGNIFLHIINFYVILLIVISDSFRKKCIMASLIRCVIKYVILKCNIKYIFPILLTSKSHSFID